MYSAEFCDPLTDPDNGDITFSSGVLVGSVATYVCDANFAVQGDVNRTCEVNGTTTMWSAAASSCVRGMSDSGTTHVNYTKISADLSFSHIHPPPTPSPPHYCFRHYIKFVGVVKYSLFII